MRPRNKPHIPLSGPPARSRSKSPLRPFRRQHRRRPTMIRASFLHRSPLLLLAAALIALAAFFAPGAQPAQAQAPGVPRPDHTQLMHLGFYLWWEEASGGERLRHPDPFPERRRLGPVVRGLLQRHDPARDCHGTDALDEVPVADSGDRWGPAECLVDDPGQWPRYQNRDHIHDRQAQPAHPARGGARHRPRDVALGGRAAKRRDRPQRLQNLLWLEGRAGRHHQKRGGSVRPRRHQRRRNWPQRGRAVRLLGSAAGRWGDRGQLQGPSGHSAARAGAVVLRSGAPVQLRNLQRQRGGHHLHPAQPGRSPGR